MAKTKKGHGNAVNGVNFLRFWADIFYGRPLILGHSKRTRQLIFILSLLCWTSVITNLSLWSVSTRESNPVYPLRDERSNHKIMRQMN